MDFESLGFRRYEGSLLEIRGNQLQSTVDQNIQATFKIIGSTLGGISAEQTFSIENCGFEKVTPGKKLITLFYDSLNITEVTNINLTEALGSDDERCPVTQFSLF